jgi:hypothetical protein
LKFNEDMTQYVPPEQLWTEYPGGKLEFEYDHSVYWPALAKLAKDRREARKARWVAGGKQLGELEDYLNGVLEQGISGSPAAPIDGTIPIPATEIPAKEEIKVPAAAHDDQRSQKAEAPNETEGEEDKVENLKIDKLKIDSKVDNNSA